VCEMASRGDVRQRCAPSETRPAILARIWQWLVKNSSISDCTSHASARAAISSRLGIYRLMLSLLMAKEIPRESHCFVPTYHVCFSSPKPPTRQDLLSALNQSHNIHSLMARHGLTAWK
jgi:hypothetical protein